MQKKKVFESSSCLNLIMFGKKKEALVSHVSFFR
jgi:hypothetical protein